MQVALFHHGPLTDAFASFQGYSPQLLLALHLGAAYPSNDLKAIMLALKQCTEGAELIASLFSLEADQRD